MTSLVKFNHGRRWGDNDIKGKVIHSMKVKFARNAVKD